MHGATHEQSRLITVSGKFLPPEKTSVSPAYARSLCASSATTFRFLIRFPTVSCIPGVEFLSVPELFEECLMLDVGDQGFHRAFQLDRDIGVLTDLGDWCALFALQTS